VKASFGLALDTHKLTDPTHAGPSHKVKFLDDFFRHSLLKYHSLAGRLEHTSFLNHKSGRRIV
jgi:hypothetical protein